MKYRMEGEDYLTLRDLFQGPVRKLHPDALSCFVENGFLVVKTRETGEHLYRLSRESASLTLVITP